MVSITDKPLAAKGLRSYRYLSIYGWVMIGAHNRVDALREAERSITGPADSENLQVWDDTNRCYTDVDPSGWMV